MFSLFFKRNAILDKDHCQLSKKDFTLKEKRKKEDDSIDFQLILQYLQNTKQELNIKNEAPNLHFDLRPIDFSE